MATSNSKKLSPRAIDEVGNVYGRLTVIAFAGRTKSGDSLWICLCECGAVVTVARGNLRKSYGGTKSCGCGRKTAGGMHKTPEYTSWKGITQRCYNPSNKAYHLYGGRGITMCDRWRASFLNFFADIGPRPSPDHSVERIDNDGNYEPGNCKWATPLEQSQNNRKALRITFSGETYCLREWARRIGVTKRTLTVRIKRWGLERALTTPPHENKQHQKHS